MTTLLFAHRDAEYFAPKLKQAFPALDIITAPDLPESVPRFPEADIIMAAGHGFNDERLAKAGRLRWIHAMTTGFDAIAASRTLRPEVVLTTTRGIHGPQMAEMAFLYMLNLARDYPRMHDNQKKHVWQRWTQVRLHDKTVVITGLGLIAEALAPRCKAFGMTVLGVSATPRDVASFDQVVAYSQFADAAARADFLVVLTPYSPAMDNLINAKILAAMKPSAYLLNLARGGLCDEAALLDALRHKRIAGAGLDVFRTEPLPKDSPFWDLNNVLITAHCSGSSDDNLAMTWPILETNVRCFLDGRPHQMMNRAPR